MWRCGLLPTGLVRSAGDLAGFAADAAVSAAAPHAVSEADEQFEVLCRALLAASQLIATVRPLFDTAWLSGNLSNKGGSCDELTAACHTARLPSALVWWHCLRRHLGVRAPMA